MPNSRNQLTFNNIIALILKNIYIFLTGLIIASIISVFVAISIPNSYTSEATIKVESSNSGGALSSLKGSLGGLGSLAGLDFLDDGSKFTPNLIIETMKSKALLKSVLELDGIKPALVAAIDYDLLNKKLIYDDTFFDSNENAWVRKANKYRKAEPSYIEIHERYMDGFRVSQDKISGFIKISFTHPSPEFSKQFIDLMIENLDSKLRGIELTRSQNEIVFLREQLDLYPQIEIKNNINSLIQSSLQNQLLAKVDKEFVVKIIDPAFVPVYKSGPLRPLICILVTLLGAILTILLIILKDQKSLAVES